MGVVKRTKTAGEGYDQPNDGSQVREKHDTYVKGSIFWPFFHFNLCLCRSPYKSEATQVEIELIGRVDGRTFDERKLEFEVGEGLNVNIPRSDLKFFDHNCTNFL